ncbi:MAG: VWA domain-containing protein [Bacteroidetes bacterium]|nr:VWA domain-containing protein [Bacteroidota bacterium]
MDIKSKRAIKTIYSPSHDVEIVRKDDYHTLISYEESNIQPKRDFVFYYSLSDSDVGIDIIAHRDDEDNDGYFMLLISPKYETKKSEIIEKDFIFVLDRSGSMRGEKIKSAKEALRFCVRNLNDGDRFNLILFSTDVETFSDELVEVKKGREKALAFIDDIENLGGTNINEALLTALREKPHPKRPRMIIFLTDGRPTVGETDIGQIIKNVTKANDENTRLFVFGVGYDVNTQLLDKLAEEYSLQLELKAYFLHPEIPPEGRERTLRDGESADDTLLGEPLRGLADDAGLIMRRAALTPYTRLAQAATEYAKAAGLQAVDNAWLRLVRKDTSEAEAEQIYAGLREKSTGSANLGMDGTWVIHPQQAEIANDCFTPSEDVIEKSKSAIEYYHQAGGGSIYNPETQEFDDEATIKAKLVDLAKAVQAGRLDAEWLATQSAKSKEVSGYDILEVMRRVA